MAQNIAMKEENLIGPMLCWGRPLISAGGNSAKVVEVAVDDAEDHSQACYTSAEPGTYGRRRARFERLGRGDHAKRRR